LKNINLLILFSNLLQKTTSALKLFILLCLVIFLLSMQSCVSFRISDKKATQKFQSAGVPLHFYNSRVSGYNLHYAQTGNANLPTIVFVHGTPGSWSAFDNYLMDSALRSKYRLISIDRPGFGHSNFGNALNLSQQSVIISSFLKEIKNVQPIFLVGHSLGGPMVCRLAIDNPGMISALVILAGSQDPAAEKPEKWRPVIFKTPLNYLIPGSWRPSNEELWYLKNDLVVLKPELSKITCPVYLLHGTKDILVPFSNVAYTDKMLTGTAKKEKIVFEDQTAKIENHFLPSKRFNEIKALLLKLY
jgi:pimeloyl-ACP methyl ester carboxylesterase